MFESFVARISNKLYPKPNSISSQICLIIYYCKSIHNALRSHQYSGTTAHITAGNGQDKSSGMCLTKSISGLSWFALDKAFLMCWLPQCLLAGQILRVGSRAVICHERGLSDQGKRLSVPSCVDIQCVWPLTHTLSKDLWKRCLDTLDHTLLVNSCRKSAFLNFLWEIPVCKGRKSKHKYLVQNSKVSGT